MKLADHKTSNISAHNTMPSAKTFIDKTFIIKGISIHIDIYFYINISNGIIYIQ